MHRSDPWPPAGPVAPAGSRGTGFARRSWRSDFTRGAGGALFALGSCCTGFRLGGHHFAQLASGMRRLPVPGDVLFVEPCVCRRGLLVQHSISAYWRGDFVTSIRACERLPSMKALPEGHSSQTRLKMQRAVRERARQIGEQSPRPRVLPHTGNPTRGRVPA